MARELVEFRDEKAQRSTVARGYKIILTLSMARLLQVTVCTSSYLSCLLFLMRQVLRPKYASLALKLKCGEDKDTQKYLYPRH